MVLRPPRALNNNPYEKVYCMSNSSTPTPETTATMKSVAFYGDHITTIAWSDNHYVAMRPIVDTLGLSWGSQSEKLDDERYSVIRIPCGTPGGTQQTICIPLKKLNGWLFSINPNKVRADLRDKLIRYQEECFEVLYQYWHKPAQFPAAYDSPFERINHRLMYELRRVNPKLVQAYLIDQGITPDLVNMLLQGQPLLEQQGAPNSNILPIVELNHYLEQNGYPYDEGHRFLFRETLENLLKDHDQITTLNHFRNIGLLWCENGRLTRKLPKAVANQYANGVRQRVYVFNYNILEG